MEKISSLICLIELRKKVLETDEQYLLNFERLERAKLLKEGTKELENAARKK